MNPKNQFTNRLLKVIANLQFAISLLFLTAILIALGTVIEQDQTIAFYKENYPTTDPLFGFLDWKILLTLGVNKLYSAPIFIITIFIFALSLIACTFTTQLPSLRKFRLWNFLTSKKQFQTLSTSSFIERNLANITFYRAHNFQYHIFRQRHKNYAYVGLFGRFAPIVVHFSMLLLVVGTSFSAFTSYNVQAIVPRGEIFHFQNIVRSGSAANLSYSSSLRVNDFWITYTKEDKTNQFYTDLSILNSSSTEINRKTIFVNEPLLYDNITVYQTDWDIIALQANINQSPPLQIPLKKSSRNGSKFWLGSISLDSANKNSFTILVRDLNKDIYLYDVRGNLIKTLALGENFSADSKNDINFSNFLTSTGLQIKEDPGLLTVYFSFLLILLSTYVSFFSYSQIWGLEQNKGLLVGGKSNRAVLAFQEESRKIFSSP